MPKYELREFLPVGGGSGTHLTWFLGPTRVHLPNGITIDSAVSVGLTAVTNKHTDDSTDQNSRDYVLRACDAT